MSEVVFDGRVDLKETDIGERTLNRLKGAGYKTVQALHGVTAAELSGITGFGSACLHDLRVGLEPYGVEVHGRSNPLTVKCVRGLLRRGYSPEAIAVEKGVGIEEAREAVEIIGRWER